MSRVRFFRGAEDEFKNAIQFYEESHKGLGSNLAQEVQVCLSRIAEMPLASKIERGDIRVRSVARFPYRVYYRPGDKVRELIQLLKSAGFIARGGKGSHRNFCHRRGVNITVSGKTGNDAKKYQVRDVKKAIELASNEKKLPIFKGRRVVR